MPTARGICAAMASDWPGDTVVRCRAQGGYYLDRVDYNAGTALLPPAMMRARRSRSGGDW
jgi:hypothetical protein